MDVLDGKLSFMKNTKFSIHRWFAVFIMLLIIPSLVLAFLWLRLTWQDRQEIDTARIGLNQISLLQPLIAARLDGESPNGQEYQTNYQEFLGSLSNKQKNVLAVHLERIKESNSAVQAVAAAHKVVLSVTQSTQVLAVTPPEAIALPELLSHFLLPVVVESSRTVRMLEAMSARKQFNDWDRMSVPVQGG